MITRAIGRARTLLKPVRGHVDGMLAGALTGWAWDARMPHENLAVSVYDGDALVARAFADVERPDVNRALNTGGAHGFSIMLPAALYDDQPHRLTVACHGRPLGWASDAPYPPVLERKHAAIAARRSPATVAAAVKAPEPDDSPQVLECEIAPAPSAGTAQAIAADGAFWIAGGALEGQVLSPAAGPLALHLLDSDRFAGEIVVALAAHTPQRFRALLPGRLIDGEEHPLTLRVAGTQALLRPRGGGERIAFRETVRGRVESIERGFVKGWAVDVRDPSEPLEIQLLDAGECVGSFIADRPRPDVSEAIGIAGTHGFLLPIPARLFDDAVHELRVHCRGRPLAALSRVGKRMPLTRQALAAVPMELRYLGAVEGLSVDTISGWAIDRMAPDSPLEIAVSVDGEPVGSTLANRFAARRRGNGQSGHHEFQLPLPTRLMNGRPRAVKAVVAGCGFQLPNALTPLRFPLVDVFGQEQPAAPDFEFIPAPAAALATVLRVPPRHGAAARRSGSPLISVIVLNWNGEFVLRQFLESFRRVQWDCACEILLVDHGSVDGSLALAQALAADLPMRIIARGANYSFAESNNLGAREARGDYLVFANNDLVMLHDCFAPMRAHFDDPQVGAVGLRLLEPLKDRDGGWRYAPHHLGVQFAPALLPGSGAPYYMPQEVAEVPAPDAGSAYTMPAATAALLMCRKADFEALGGFHEGYRYGMEDVDLCLALRERLGKRVVCDTGAVALHNRSATRESKLRIDVPDRQYDDRRRADNHALYAARHGRRLARTILRALLEGDTFWRARPLRVTFAVTAASPGTAAGDFFTAMELGEALRRLYRWEVLFGANGNTDLPGTDVVVAMRHDFALRAVTGLNPGAIAVAWVRNRVDQWLESPDFPAYHLVLASSKKAAEHIRARSGRECALLPIATNARRFASAAPLAAHASDVAFTGHYWGAERDALGLLEPASAGHELAIYGKGWDGHPRWQRWWRGAAPYSDLPGIYASAKIVLDDSHPVTRDWNSLNSRVFDALACGRLVLTNCAGGARELFPGLLPAFSSQAALGQQLRHYLEHPDERDLLAKALQQEVLGKHTYDHRAADFKVALVRHAEGGTLRFAVKVGVPRMSERERWGDWHFALGIVRALQARGHYARIDILPDWNRGLAAGDDVVIVLRGLSEYRPQPTAVNLLWLISHPDEVSVAELQNYDHVFVASQPFTARLKEPLGDKVSTLLQCTDPALFFPEKALPAVPDVVFIGNSRGQRREAVAYAQQKELDFAVYGGMWSHMLPAERIKGEYLPNDTLRHYYAGAKVVLNDHWPDMREHGFVSNRVFDAGACGAAIVTDEMPACRALFGDALAYYRNADGLAAEVRRLQADPQQREAMGERLRSIVLKAHTFEHRVEEILRVALPLHTGEGARPGR